MSNYDEKADIAFEQKTWKAARVTFSQKHEPKNFEPFLKDYTTPEVARKSVIQARKEASSEYNNKLGGILEKVDMFMTVGDLAMKSAPESVGLAWTGIRMCLHAVQDDFVTFALFSGTCSDILGILISCRVYGKLYAQKDRPDDSVELHDKVLSYIEDTYTNIIEFSYQMWKYTRSNTGVRIIKGLLRSAQGKFQPMIGSLRENESQMNKFATQASQQMSEYYLRKGLSNDEILMKSFSDQREMLQEMQDASAKQNQMFMNILKHQTELHNKNANKSAADVARETMEQQLKELGPMVDNYEAFRSKIDLRKQGTCLWVLDNEDFKTFADSERGKIVWLVGSGGSGKSFLMSTVIEEMQRRVKEKNDSLVHYFYISKSSQATSTTEEILKDLLVQLYKTPDLSLDALDKCNKAVKNYLRDNKVTAGSRSGQTTTPSASTETFNFARTYKTLAKAIDKRIFLVIDALDECIDLEAENFIESIKSLVNDEELRINVYFSGRDELNIATPLQDCARISVESNNIVDIERNVQIEMEKLPGFTAGEREQARQEITRKAGSYFRYVELAIDFMRQPWRRPLSKHLESLPPGINNLYAQRLEKTNPVYYDLLTSCLTWTILAGREMTVQELIDVYRGTYTSEEVEENAPEEDEGTDQRLYEEQIVKAGNEFLRVSPDHTVSTVHNTVRDFFLKAVEEQHETDEKVVNGVEVECPCARCQAEVKQTKNFQVSEKEGHLHICITMLQHLLSPSFQRKYFVPENPHEGDSEGGDAGSHSDEVDAPEDKSNGSNSGTVKKFQGSSAIDQDLVVNGADADQDLSNGIGDATSSSQVKQEIVTSDISNVKEDSVGVSGQDISERSGVVAANDLNESAPENGEHNETEQTVESANLQEHPMPPAQAEDSEDGASEDGLSIADSDDRFERKDGDWDLGYAEVGAEDLPCRYEVQYLLWHLMKLEELYDNHDRKGERWDQLNSLLDKFFVHESESWLGWMRTLWAIDEVLDWIASPFDDYKAFHPIHVAASYGLASVVAILMARPDASEIAKKPMWYGSSPLWDAAMWQAVEGKSNTNIFKLLLEAGADPNEQITVGNTPKSTPFGALLVGEIVAVDQIELFLRHGADVNALSASGVKPFHSFAAGRSGVTVAKALIEAGADINGRSKIGETPLHWLVRRPELSLDVLEYFLEAGAEVNAEDDASERPLAECAKLGHIEAIKLLLDHGADLEDASELGLTALFTSATQGKPVAVKYLLERGADPFKTSSIGSTAFNAAVRNGDEESALILGRVFIDQGRTDLLDFSYPNGKSTLMKAATKGYLKVIDLILDNVNPETALSKVSKKGRQALHFAAMKGRKVVVEKLLARGADATSKDKKGLTPLQLCCSKVVDKPTKEIEETILLLIQHGPDAAVADVELLHTLVIYNAVSVVDKFLQLGADPFINDVHGWNALQLAKRYERLQIVESINASQPKTHGLRPTRFAGKAAKTYTWSDDGLALEKTVVEQMSMYEVSAGAVMCRPSDQSFVTDHPIPITVDRYYFEVTLLPQEIEEKILVAVGACQKPPRALKLWFPGWWKAGMSSWGYHSDDGQIYCSGDAPLKRDLGLARKWGPGETVGCGIDLKRHEIFWTLNGQRLMKAGWVNVRGQVYPVISLSSKGKITMNLGADTVKNSFMWKPGNTLDFDSDVPPPTLTRWKTGELKT